MYAKTLVAAALTLSFAAAADAQTFRERATCKLTNTAANATLYEGGCTVTQKPGSGNNTVITVKMGSGEPFMFAGVKGERNWMKGPERVDFTDLPAGGIFKWGTFALVVAE